MRTTIGLAALAMLAGAAGNAVAQVALYGLSYHSAPTQISGDGRYVIGEFRSVPAGIERSARWDVLAQTAPVLVQSPGLVVNSTGVALSADGRFALSWGALINSGGNYDVVFVTDIDSGQVSQNATGLIPRDLSGVGHRVLVSAPFNGGLERRAEVRDANTFGGGPVAPQDVDAARMSADTFVVGANEYNPSQFNVGRGMRWRSPGTDMQYICDLAALGCGSYGYGGGNYKDPEVKGVSADGGVLVGAIDVGDGYGGFVSRQPFRWRETPNEFTIIGDCLFGGGGEAVDASAGGARVVGNYFCNDSGGPFLYDASSGDFQYIANILFNAGVDLSRWLIGQAVAISDDGQWITGNGSYIDSFSPIVVVQRPWVAFIPLGGGACDSLDFNGDGVFPDNQDYIDLLTVFAGGTCSNDPFCGDLDFNNDGVFPDNKDINDYLSYFAGGPCPT